MRFLSHLKSPFAKRIVLALCIAFSALALQPDNVVFGQEHSVRMGGAYQDGTQIRYSVCISPVLKPAPTPTPDHPQVRGGVIVFDPEGSGSAEALIAFVFRVGDSCKSGSYGPDQDDGNRTIRIEVNHVFDTYSVGSPSSESVSSRLMIPLRRQYRHQLLSQRRFRHRRQHLPNANAYTHAVANAHTVAFTHANSYALAGPTAAAPTHTTAEAHTHSSSAAPAPSHTRAYTYANSAAATHADAYPHTGAHADTNSNTQGCAHSRTHCYPQG